MGHRLVQRIFAWLLVGTGIVLFIHFSPVDPTWQRLGAAVAAAGVVWHLSLNRAPPSERRGFPVVSKGSAAQAADVFGSDKDPEGDAANAPPLVPLYRKVMAAVLGLAGVALLIVGFFAESAPARANIGATAFGFILFAGVIRFQHIRF